LQAMFFAKTRKIALTNERMQTDVRFRSPAPHVM
jgi:hypothetical protein